MFEAMKIHLAYATNEGNIRSTITVFPSRQSGYPDVRLWNQQLISYAGYRQPDGTCLGDPINIEFAEVSIVIIIIFLDSYKNFNFIQNSNSFISDNRNNQVLKL